MMDRLHRQGILATFPLLALALALLIGYQVPAVHGLECPVCAKAEDLNPPCELKPCNSEMNWKAATIQNVENSKPLLKKLAERLGKRMSDQELDIAITKEISKLLNKVNRNEVFPPQYVCSTEKMWFTANPKDGALPNLVSNECIKVTSDKLPRDKPYTEIKEAGEAVAQMFGYNGFTKVDMMVCDEAVGMGPDCGPQAADLAIQPYYYSNSGRSAINHFILLMGLGFGLLTLLKPGKPSEI